MPGRLLFRWLRLASAAATTTLGWATAAATATAPVVVGTGTTGTRWATSGWLAGGDRRTVGAGEGGLILFVELLAAFFFVEVLSAFNQDRALIGARLAFVEFTARARRPAGLLRCFFSPAAAGTTGIAVLEGSAGSCCQLGFLFANESLATELDAIAFDGQNLDHD